MDDIERFLSDHTSLCIFPIKDPKTGKTNRLCQAMTYKENGRQQPFCPEHTKEIKRILELKRKSPKIRHKPLKVSGGV